MTKSCHLNIPARHWVWEQTTQGGGISELLFGRITKRSVRKHTYIQEKILEAAPMRFPLPLHTGIRSLQINEPSKPEAIVRDRIILRFQSSKPNSWVSQTSRYGTQPRLSIETSSIWFHCYAIACCAEQDLDFIFICWVCILCLSCPNWHLIHRHAA